MFRRTSLLTLSALTLFAQFALIASCGVASADEELQVLPPEPLPPTGVLSPANVRPVLFSDDVANVSFRRIDNDGNENVVPFEKSAPLFDHAAYLLDVGRLEEGEQLDILARCDDCPDEIVAALSGSWPRNNVDDVTPPAFADEAVEVHATAFGYESLSYTHFSITVKLPPLDEPVAMRFAGDEVDVVLEPLGSPEFPYNFNVAGAEARTTCFRAVAIDGAGNETAFAEELCAVLDPRINSSSCAQTGGTSTACVVGALAVLAALAAPARRRHRLQRV